MEQKRQTIRTSSMPTQPARPIVVTIVSVIGLLVYGLALLAFIWLLVQARILSTHLSVNEIGFIVFTSLLGVGKFASFIGYLRMQKWGVYVYTALFVLETGFGLYANHFRIATTSFTPLLLSLAFVVVGLVYVRRMR